MDCFDKFDETTLPNIENFYSKLELSNIDVKDDNHAKKVWDIFNIKNMGGYHHLYVQADTDVFENFRSLCLKEYQLDPACYVSTPSLAYDAMLKITGAKIELFTDIDMVLITTKRIRSGLTQVIKKYSVANSKYLPDYDKTKDTTYLQYLDANNLHGYGINKKLPLYLYEWDDVSIFTEDFTKNYDDNSDKGYLLEVDIEYPKELHTPHKDLLLLPEKKSKLHKEYKHRVTKDIKNAHKKVYKSFNITHEPENKLIATVQDKNKYVANISILKQALNHGFKLTEVHRVIKYNQSNWLKPHIDKNAALRKLAKNQVETS